MKSILSSKHLAAQLAPIDFSVDDITQVQSDYAINSLFLSGTSPDIIRLSGHIDNDGTQTHFKGLGGYFAQIRTICRAIEDQPVVLSITDHHVHLIIGS